MWAKLEAFCRQPGQRFECEGAGEHENEQYTAQIEHVLYSSAGLNELQFIREQLQDLAEPFISFYQRYDGAQLFCDTMSEAVGLSIAPVREWEQLRTFLLDWFIDFSDEDFGYYTEMNISEEDIKQAVVFAEVPHSGNYFTVVTTGRHRGRIFYFCHDGMEYELYADNFDSFIRPILTDPANELLHLGCYTRYSDGKTDIQWIPRRFLTDNG